MNANELTERYHDLNDRHEWPIGKLETELEINLKDSQNKLLKHFRKWEEINQQNSPDANIINKNNFELFLQSRNLITLKKAAIQMALSKDNFKHTLERLIEEELISENESNGIYPNILSALTTKQLHKNIVDLNKKIYSTRDSYIKDLHTYIQEKLGIGIKTIFCETSQILNPESPEPASDFDDLTGEPIGLKYRIYLDSTYRPIQIPPLKCSLTTYAKFEEYIRKYVLAGAEKLTPDAKNKLTNTTT